MKFKITLPVPWRHGRRRYQPGPYRVPMDMSPETAELAIRQAGAFKEMPKSVGAPVVTQDEETTSKPKRKKAPKNKSLNAAPENKSEMD